MTKGKMKVGFTSNVNMYALKAKIKELMRLTAETTEMFKGEENISSEWDEMLSDVSNLNNSLHKVVTSDILNELHEAIIVITGDGKEEDFDRLNENLSSEYMEFTRTKTEREGTKITFTGLWDGSTDDLIKLTHHAEALYEGTGIQFIHVEVCVDGTWYGKENKQIKVIQELPNGLHLFTASIYVVDTDSEETWYVVGKTHDSALKRFNLEANRYWYSYQYSFHEVTDEKEVFDFIKEHAEEKIKAGIYVVE